jgi:hypothetical protein
VVTPWLGSLGSLHGPILHPDCDLLEREPTQSGKMSPKFQANLLPPPLGMKEMESVGPFTTLMTIHLTASCHIPEHNHLVVIAAMTSELTVGCFLCSWWAKSPHSASYRRVPQQDTHHPAWIQPRKWHRLCIHNGGEVWLLVIRGSSRKGTLQLYIVASVAHHLLQNKQQTPWLEVASKLYRPSDRHLSAKLVPTFADGGVSRSQHSGSPTAVISVF